MKKAIDIIWSNYIKQANAFVSDLAAGIGLTYKAVEYLWAIADLGECTCTELAKVLYLKKPSVSHMVESLLAKDCLIKMQDSGDKRSFKVKLSQLGQKYIDLEWGFYENYIEQFKQYLSQEESAILTELLDKIAIGINYENN